MAEGSAMLYPWSAARLNVPLHSAVLVLSIILCGLLFWPSESPTILSAVSPWSTSWMATPQTLPAAHIRRPEKAVPFGLPKQWAVHLPIFASAPDGANEGDNVPGDTSVGWQASPEKLAFIGSLAIVLGIAGTAIMGRTAQELPSLSHMCGATSLVIWLVSQVPQMLKNQQRRKAEDLSIDFLLLWTLGDVCNLAGCFLISGTFTQRALAIYFIFCNIILLLQWWYFGRSQKSGDGMPPASKAFWVALMGGSSVGLVSCLIRGLPKAVVGDYLGWVSGAVYLISRVPQIWQNYISKRVDDLSPFLFVLAALGNTTYAASILAVSLGGEWLRMQAPFLVGSIGTLFFDAVLLSQIAVYRKPAANAKGQP